MNAVLITLAFSLVMALSAAFAVPMFVDWNSYRTEFEQRTSQILGRKVQVAGDVDLRLLPTPTVRLFDVRLADAKGRLDQPVLNVKAFTLDLAIPPLFRGVLEAKSVEITEPHFQFRVASGGLPDWQGLGGTGEGLPFVPAGVALNDVHIRDGRATIALVDSGREIVVPAIHGRFAANALSGPYRFTGTLGEDAAKTRVSLATGSWSAQTKAMNVSATITRGDWPGRVTFEGQYASAIEGTAALGTLQIQLPAITTATAPGAGISGTDTSGTASEGVAVVTALAPDFKGQVRLDGRGLALTEGAFSIAENGRIQTLALSGQIDWQKAVRLEANAKASYFDLDRVLPGLSGRPLPVETGAAPIGGPRWLAEHVPDALAILNVFDGYRLEARFERAGVRGDLIGDVRAILSGAGEAAKLEALSANLPGGTRAQVSGALTLAPGAVAFSGPFDWTGRDLGQLARWMRADVSGRSLAGAQYFSARGDLSLSPETIALADVRGDLEGSAFTGALRYRFGQSPDVLAELQSDRLDLRDLAGAGSGLGPVVAALLGRDKAPQVLLTEPAAGDTEEPQSLVDLLEEARGRLNVSVGRILLPGFDGRDLEADASMADGRLTIKKLNIASAEGLQVTAEGDLTELGRRTTGDVRFTLAAETPDAVGQLAALAGGHDLAGPHLARMAPLRLAGALGSHPGPDKSRDAADVQIDGAVGGTQVTLAGRLDGLASGLAVDAVEVFATARNPEAEALLTQLFPSSVEALRAIGVTGSGQMWLRAAGRLDEGVATAIDLDAAGITAQVIGTAQSGTAQSGTGRTGRDGWTRFSGEASAEAPSSALVYALLGVAPDLGTQDRPMVARAKLGLENNRLTLDAIDYRHGPDLTRGQITLDYAAAVPILSAQLDSDEVALPKLLGPLLQRQTALARPGSAAANLLAEAREATQNAEESSRAVYWPNRPFERALFASGQSDIAITSRRLRLSESLVATDAKLAIKTGDGRLTVETLNGRLFDGALSVAGRMEPVASGMRLEGKASITDGALASLTRAADGTALADGGFSATMTLSGEGLSPLGLIAVATGTAELQLTASTIAGLNPAALPEIAARGAARPEPASLASAAADKPAAAKEPAEKTFDSLVARLREGTFPVEPTTVRFTIKNGTARAEPVTLKPGGTEAKVAAFIDLSSMTLDSEWILSIPTRGSSKIPSVELAFAGPVASFTAIQPTLDTRALERYLAEQRVETDMRKLEELDRQVTELARAKEAAERAAAEAEKRRKALREERARAEAKARAEADAAARARTEAELAAGIVRQDLPPLQGGTAGGGIDGAASGAAASDFARQNALPPGARETLPWRPEIRPTPPAEQKPKAFNPFEAR